MSSGDNGTVTNAALGTLLRDGKELMWAFLNAAMPSSVETEPENNPTASSKTITKVRTFPCPCDAD